MDHTEIQNEDVDWIGLLLDTDWWNHVKVEMNVQVPQKASKLSTG
jgi:hypothetical protein